MQLNELHEDQQPLVRHTLIYENGQTTYFNQQKGYFRAYAFSLALFCSSKSHGKESCKTTRVAAMAPRAFSPSFACRLPMTSRYSPTLRADSQGTVALVHHTSKTTGKGIEYILVFAFSKVLGKKGLLKGYLLNSVLRWWWWWWWWWLLLLLLSVFVSIFFHSYHPRIQGSDPTVEHWKMVT